MVGPFTTSKQGHQVFFWNIDSNVGLGSPNKQEDVELVQFGYFAMAQSPKVPQTLRAVCAAVVPGAIYRGSPQDPLTIAILAHQKSRGGTQDGHVSVISGGGVYDGQHSFMLVSLVNNTFDLMPGEYPRLDKHPRCPSQLRAAVIRCFTL